jgi:hypothetical protein
MRVTYGAVKVEFERPRSRVSIDASRVSQLEFVGTPTTMCSIEAFDGNGQIIAKTLYSATYGQPSWGSAETLNVSAASAAIEYVLISSRYVSNTIHVYGTFDNLRFSNETLIKSGH